LLQSFPIIGLAAEVSGFPLPASEPPLILQQAIDLKINF